MQHEVLAVLAFQRVDDLLVLAGAEGGDAERLRLAAGEQGGAVRAGQQPDLGDDRPDGFGVAAVDTQSGAEDGAAHHVGFQILESALGLFGVETLGLQRFHGGGFGGADRVMTGALVDDLVGIGDPGAGQRVDAGFERLDLGRGCRQLPRLLGGMLGQFDDGVDHRLKGCMPEGHGAQKDVLGEFASLGFDHQHALGGAGDDQLQGAGLVLRHGGIEDVLAILIPNRGGGDGPEEGNAGQGQRRRAADQCHDVGIILHVVRQDGGDDLHLVAEALREQRADRAVDEAAFQHLRLTGPSFALEEAAGDLARGEGFFLVVDGQREEILTGFGGLHANGGAEHDGLAVRDQHGAIGLAGDLAGFQDQLAPAPVEFLAEIIEHSASLRCTASADGKPVEPNPSCGGRRRLG